MRLQFWAADTLRFSVTGPEPHRFLNRAAAAGVRLRRVRWQKDGYTATASGPDRRRPEEIAAILDGKDRQKAGMLAPASGLCLMEVYYQ